MGKKRTNRHQRDVALPADKPLENHSGSPSRD
ncbi:hypothetical protein SV7mr_25640 [Stieleria bergensis]|uniref:Uncharacterized protein n=1 Tax=Stieleria bergensis TaxID=2528025 RepID=A0A517SV85_9BACT|nr:hypothetical protein SV7mr_25640 [Planctomycetes bacterium SV_7m_r]